SSACGWPASRTSRRTPAARRPPPRASWRSRSRLNRRLTGTLPGSQRVPAMKVLVTEQTARWFFAAHLQSALGTGAAYVALLVLAYDRLGSACGATAVLLADLAPAMLLGPLLG